MLQYCMKKMVILIPPSEGKTPGGVSPALKKPPKNSKEIIERINAVSKLEWPKILGVKGKALDQAVVANKEILTSKTMPAIDRYSGVVYKAIDYPSMDEQSKKYLDEHVRIVSSVFGLVKPTDLIPDYKLKIDKLKSDKYWAPINSQALKTCFSFDLLPLAQKKAAPIHDGKSIDFVIMKNGKKTPAGHMGKHIKGRFIRWLCETQVSDIKDFKKFKEDGFCWKEGVFIKND